MAITSKNEERTQILNETLRTWISHNDQYRAYVL